MESFKEIITNNLDVVAMVAVGIFILIRLWFRTVKIFIKILFTVIILGGAGYYFYDKNGGELPSFKSIDINLHELKK